MPGDEALSARWACATLTTSCRAPNCGRLKLLSLPTSFSGSRLALSHDQIQRSGAGTLQQRTSRARRGLQVEALDAAQPFDYEARQEQRLQAKQKLKIGIVGFGNFGQFLAARMVKQGHVVIAHSRSDYSERAAELNVHYFRDPDDFCEEHPEVVVLCTSILSSARVLRELPVQRLKRSTLFVDVLSVKMFPRQLFLQALPPDFDLLCTHPMFGPESGRGSWQNLPFMFDRVRVGEGRRAERCERFVEIFANEGCRMVEMTCEEHDKYAAGSQFLTHTVGRMLGKLGMESTPINTKGFESLLTLVENTQGDSFDLYYGLFLYNSNATQLIKRLEAAFDELKYQLLEQMYSVAQQQLFHPADAPPTSWPPPPPPLPPPLGSPPPPTPSPQPQSGTPLRPPPALPPKTLLSSSQLRQKARALRQWGSRINRAEMPPTEPPFISPILTSLSLSPILTSTRHSSPAPQQVPLEHPLGEYFMSSSAPGPSPQPG